MPTGTEWIRPSRPRVDRVARWYSDRNVRASSVITDPIEPDSRGRCLRRARRRLRLRLGRVDEIGDRLLERRDGGRVDDTRRLDTQRRLERLKCGRQLGRQDPVDRAVPEADELQGLLECGGG